MSERLIEMLWRCTSCGSRNLGRHMKCQQCGNPKDGSEEWEMPEDTSAAPTVTDPKLLGLAQSAPAWRCTYCGSDQRSAQGACAQCGAPAQASQPIPEAPDAPAAPAASSTGAAAGLAAAGRTEAPAGAPTPPRWRRSLARILLVAGGAVAIGGIAVYLLGRPREVSARVEAVAWEHMVAVDRYQLVPHEGFAEARPKDALEVKSQGPRVHHQEQVLDHYDSQPYQAQVQDGYTTEHYTTSVRCGESCTSRPQHCSERCSSRRNGFASCRTVCSGGGERCTPRYCPESRTRSVPRYRSETRYRQVPVYRQEPRYAESFTWKAWEWKPSHVARAAGKTPETRWPTEQEVNGPPLAEGEKVRGSRSETYAVTFAVERRGEKKRLAYAPTNDAEFGWFTVGSEHKLLVQGDKLLAVDGKAVPVPPPAPTARP